MELSLSLNKATSQRLLVAIDIAQKAHSILIPWPTGKSKNFKIPCSQKEFEKLTNCLLAQDLPVITALELTVDYCALAY